ncbi:MAG: hypothetical protein M0022_05700 [Desulfobacteraceae bacterium]|nr:hypothetical protein [Desulfobacteraceae bacterium]
MTRHKKNSLPGISHILVQIKDELPVRIFTLNEIPEALAWAERGHIAVHENFRSRKRQSYHVICSDKEPLLYFCQRLGLPTNDIVVSEFYRFWHLTWFLPSGNASC